MDFVHPSISSVSTAGHFYPGDPKDGGYLYHVIEEDEDAFRALGMVQDSAPDPEPTPELAPEPAVETAEPADVAEPAAEPAQEPAAEPVQDVHEGMSVEPPPAV